MKVRIRHVDEFAVSRNIHGGGEKSKWRVTNHVVRSRFQFPGGAVWLAVAERYVNIFFVR